MYSELHLNNDLNDLVASICKDLISGDYTITTLKNKTDKVKQAFDRMDNPGLINDKLVSCLELRLAEEDVLKTVCRQLLNRTTESWASNMELTFSSIPGVLFYLDQAVTSIQRKSFRELLNQLETEYSDLGPITQKLIKRIKGVEDKLLKEDCFNSQAARLGLTAFATDLHELKEIEQQKDISPPHRARAIVSKIRKWKHRLDNYKASQPQQESSTNPQPNDFFRDIITFFEKLFSRTATKTQRPQAGVQLQKAATPLFCRLSMDKEPIHSPGICAAC